MTVTRALFTILKRIFPLKAYARINSLEASVSLDCQPAAHCSAVFHF